MSSNAANCFLEYIKRFPFDGSLTFRISRPTNNLVTQLDTDVSLFRDMSSTVTYLFYRGTLEEDKLIVIRRETRILVSYECEGADFIAGADSGADGIKHVA